MEHDFRSYGGGIETGTLAIASSGHTGSEDMSELQAKRGGLAMKIINKRFPTSVLASVDDRFGAT